MFAGSNEITFYIKMVGNAFGVEVNFIERLKQRCHLCEVYSEEECDVMFAFVPIVSRSGKDIETALQKITETSKPILLVVFHHTFDKNYVAPDSRWSVKRKDVFAVDILFHEDEGLLRCQHNDMALKSATDFLTSVRAPPDILVSLELLATNYHFHYYLIYFSIMTLSTRITQIYSTKLILCFFFQQSEPANVREMSHCTDCPSFCCLYCCCCCLIKCDFL